MRNIDFLSRITAYKTKIKHHRRRPLNKSVVITTAAVVVNFHSTLCFCGVRVAITNQLHPGVFLVKRMVIAFPDIAVESKLNRFGRPTEFRERDRSDSRKEGRGKLEFSEYYRSTSIPVFSVFRQSHFRTRLNLRKI